MKNAAGWVVPFLASCSFCCRCCTCSASGRRGGWRTRSRLPTIFWKPCIRRSATLGRISSPLARCWIGTWVYSCKAPPSRGRGWGSSSQTVTYTCVCGSTYTRACSTIHQIHRLLRLLAKRWTLCFGLPSPALASCGVSGGRICVIAMRPSPAPPVNYHPMIVEPTLTSPASGRASS